MGRCGSRVHAARGATRYPPANPCAQVEAQRSRPLPLGAAPSTKRYALRSDLAPALGRRASVDMIAPTIVDGTIGGHQSDSDLDSDVIAMTANGSACGEAAGRWFSGKPTARPERLDLRSPENARRQPHHCCSHEPPTMSSSGRGRRRTAAPGRRRAEAAAPSTRDLPGHRVQTVKRDLAQMNVKPSHDRARIPLGHHARRVLGNR
jgi:hypothetical protein